MAKELGKAASEDLLLKNHATEIQTQAVLLVFHVKGKIYRTVDLKSLVTESGIKSEEEVRTRIEETIKRDGFNVEFDAANHSLKV